MRILLVLAAAIVGLWGHATGALAQSPPATEPSSGTPTGVRVSEVTGKPVRNAQNERLGTIEDIVIAGDRTVLAVRMSEWEAKVGEFANDAKRKTEAGAAEASARVSSAWGKVKQQWSSLSEATGEKWETAKRSFEQSWQEFQREWSRSADK